MNLLNGNAIFSEIDDAIDRLASEYLEHKALILTERDLQCLLFNRLSELPSLAGRHSTVDTGITGTRVHADLSWFDDSNKLSIVPDISILEVDQLSIFRSIEGAKLPSKQFSFGGKAIIFELKFCRRKSGITDKYCQDEIQKDIKKIGRLMKRLEANGFADSLFCYFVVFSKHNAKGALFEELLRTFTQPSCKLIYRTVGISSPSAKPPSSVF